VKSRIYFPGLDGIRFLAAMFVVIGHTEQFKTIMGIINTYDESFFLNRITLSANDAVLMFFVLSGFLITYLLLVEIERTDNVSIRDFYIRRTLRIWPLYYLLVLVGFFLVPIIIKLTGFDGYYQSISKDFVPKFALYLTFLPNVATIFAFMPVGISHLWTIGVEEYFYLLWPQLIKRFRKNILPAIIAVMLIRLLIMITVYFRFTIRGYSPLRPGGFDLVILALNKFPFEAMAIGGLAAYIYYHQKESILRVLYHPIMMYSILGLLAVNMVVHSSMLAPYTLFFSTFLINTFYAILILNIATNPRFPLKLENPFFRRMGKLSYGIYMYHLVVIYFTMIAFDKFNYRRDDLLYNLLLYTIVFSVTLALAHFSYKYFEKPFLRLKERFAVVKSGHAVETETTGSPG